MRKAGLLFSCIVVNVTFIFAHGATAKVALGLKEVPNDFAGILLRVKSKCIKVQGKRVCFEDDDGDQDDDDDEPKKKKKKGDDKAKTALFTCSAEIDHPKLGRSGTLRNTRAANEAEARRNFNQSLKDDNSTLKGPVTCTQH